MECLVQTIRHSLDKSSKEQGYLSSRLWLEYFPKCEVYPPRDISSVVPFTPRKTFRGGETKIKSSLSKRIAFCLSFCFLLNSCPNLKTRQTEVETKMEIFFSLSVFLFSSLLCVCVRVQWSEPWLNVRIMQM